MKIYKAKYTIKLDHYELGLIKDALYLALSTSIKNEQMYDDMTKLKDKIMDAMVLKEREVV